MLQAELRIDALYAIDDFGRAPAQRRAAQQTLVIGRTTLARSATGSRLHVILEVGPKALASLLAGTSNMHVARIRDRHLLRPLRRRHRRPIAFEDRQVVLRKAKQAWQAERQAEFDRQITGDGREPAAHPQRRMRLLNRTWFEPHLLQRRSKAPRPGHLFFAE